MLNPQQIRAAMKVPPEQKKDYQKIIVAGMKVMFSDQTHSIFDQQMKQSPDMVKNLSDGIAGLMAILWDQSKHQMPQNLIVPASLELLAHAMDYITRAKLGSFDAATTGAATEATTYAVLQRFGVSRQQADQTLQQMQAKGAQR